MELEKLHIKVGLSGTYWDRRPIYNILFNDQLLFTQEIKGNSDEVEYIEFDVEYSSETAVLKIQLVNKTSQDTLENEDKTAIVKDMLLNICSIEIDDIDLGQLPFKLSEYQPDSPVTFNGETTQLLRNCINLGFNGTWSLTWTNPLYIWLVENL